MSTLSKKLFISVLTLIITAGAFAATTFAWFTLGDEVTVSNIQGTVVAGEGLEIRLGTTGEWKSFISQSDIATYLASSGGTWEFDKFGAVTSIDGQSFTKLSVTDNEAGTMTFPAASTKEYVELIFEFRSKIEGKIQLFGATLTQTGAVLFTNDGTVFKNAAGTDVANGETVTEYISSSARISIVEGTIPTTKVVIEQTIGTDGNISGSGVLANGSHSFFKSRNSVALGTTYDGHFATYIPAPALTPASSLSTTPVDVVTLGALSGGYHSGTITVKVWIEGFDVNAYNPVFGQILNISLNFKRVNA